MDQRTKDRTGNRVQPTVPVLALAHSYLVSKFIFPKQLHTVCVAMLRATVHISHLLISATKPCKHGGREAEEGEFWRRERENESLLA